MKFIINFFWKAFNKIIYWAYALFSYIFNKLAILSNNVYIVPPFKINGFLTISVAKTGCLKIGRNIVINSGSLHNRVGRPQRTTFIVGENAEIIIGANVKMSNTVIIAQKSVLIGNDVGIGANTIIYDTDFHNVMYDKRVNLGDLYDTVKRAPVIIGDGVFIGGHCLILKGVKVGERSIVGAGSVVTKSIPPDELWAGNPARFIRKL